MKMKDFLDKAISTEPFNTNNAWGFGGAIGKSFKFKGGVEIRSGVASFRHLPPHHFTAVYLDGKRIIDQTGPLTEDQIDSLTNLITQ